MADYPIYDSYPVWRPTKQKIPTLEWEYSVEQVESQGIWIRWESAARCPCTANNGKYGPKENCTYCQGTGWIHHHPQDTKALVQGFQSTPNMLNQSFIDENGGMYFSVRGEHCPAKYDRITMLDSRMPVTALLIRSTPRAVHSGDTAYESLNFPIAKKSISQRLSSGALSEYDLDVTYLQSVDAVTGLPDAVLIEGTDFTVDYTTDGIGQLNWAIGDLKSTPTTPDVKQTFTISYFTRPVYRVVSYPHTIRDTTSNKKDASGRHIALPVQFKAEMLQDLRELFNTGD